MSCTAITVTATMLIASASLAQSITFETLPDGSPTLDRQLISDQYVADFGVRFDLVDPITLEIVGSPQIAKVGNPRTAFNACGPDTPKPGQGVGQSFLTDDGTVGSNVETLLVTYTELVSTAAGIVIDTDTRVGASYEEWTVEALDSSMNILETIVITAPDGPDTCNNGQGPGDGAADSFLFDRPTADIKFIVLRYTGTASDIGLAFDSFSPTQIPPAPAATLAISDENPCPYDRVLITPDVTNGLAPFTYQWQSAPPMGSFSDILNGFEPILETAAVPGYEYRTVLTDVLGRQFTTDPITPVANLRTRTMLSVETSAGSGVFDLIATDITPLITDTDIETYFGWTSGQEYFHGLQPTLTLDRSHLFLSAGLGGQSLVTVHDSATTNGNGKAEMRMNFVGATPVFTAKDDPTGDLYNGGGTATLKVRSDWTSPNTDGWAAGALEGAWSADVLFSDEFAATPNIEGLDSWAFYSGDGSVYELPLEEDRIVRIESGCFCVADLNFDHELDFLDISAFLGAYASADPLADLNNDGQYDFLDISAFLGAYSSGCP